MKRFCLLILLLLFSFTIVLLARDKRQHVKYESRYEDPILKKIREQDEARRDSLKKITDEIVKRHEQERKKEREERKVMRVDFSDIKVPESPDVFKQLFHFPPVRQYRTGTCWSFSTTSFLESEIYRVTGKKIKMSEMFTVYWEYVEKVKGYVQERGYSFFGQGSQANAVTKIWKKYGAVPLEVYPGVLNEKGWHDHSPMFNEIKSYLEYIKENNLWDEDQVVETVKLILNKYLGKPPVEFEFEGREFTPLEFLKYLGLNMDDYVCFISTLKYPFYEYHEYKVPDNWWHDSSYYNVPLEQFYQICKEAVNSGYTVTIGGDVSEPGINGFADAAIIPTYDIPQKYIDQDSREFRIYNGTTTDDHGIHIVGYKKLGRDEWFLIKDSSTQAYMGKHPGYIFYRADYIKLKMRTIMVHRSLAEKVLKGHQF